MHTPNVRETRRHGRAQRVAERVTRNAATIMDAATLAHVSHALSPAKRETVARIMAERVQRPST